MQWLSDMQFDNVDFETDSKITRDSFHSTHDNIFEFGYINTSCWSPFSSSFTNSRVEFVRRHANAVALVLVGEATLLVNHAVYFTIPIVLNLLLLMKCYKHISLKKHITQLACLVRLAK